VDLLPLVIVLGLAAQRVAMVVTEDSIFEPVRERVGRGARQGSTREWLANLIMCPWCFGVWAAFAVTGLWFWATDWPGLGEYLVTALAVAGTQVLFHATYRRLEGKSE
jgi:hypothetical protein